jgi:hypothetical protein
MIENHHLSDSGRSSLSVPVVRRGGAQQGPAAADARDRLSPGRSLGSCGDDRNRRGPGYRVLGLRGVDASTRGPVSIRSAVVAAFFDSACQPATNSLPRPQLNREMGRMTAVRPQLKEIEREYPLTQRRGNRLCCSSTRRIA